MPRKWKKIGTIGDINPVDHGGGVVFKHGRNEYVLVYNRYGLSDLPSEFLAGEDDEDTELSVLFLELPKTYAAFLEAYGDADWNGSSAIYGIDQPAFAEMVREMRFAKGDVFAMKATYMIEMLIVYGGSDAVDGDIKMMPAWRLQKLFDKEGF